MRFRNSKPVSTPADHPGDPQPDIDVPAPDAPRPPRRRKYLYALTIFLLAFPLLLLFGLQSGPAGRVVKEEALAVLAAVLPKDTSAQIGSARIVIDGLEGIAVRLDNLALNGRDGGEPLLVLDRAVVGIHTLSIFAGRPKVEYLTFRSGTVTLPGAGTAGASWPEIRSLNDALRDALALAGQAVGSAEAAGLPQGIELSDIRIIRASGQGAGDIVVNSARLWGRGARTSLRGEVSFLGQTSAIAASMERDETGLLSVKLDAEDFPLPIGRIHTMLSGDEADHQPGRVNPPVPAYVSIEAGESEGGPPGLSIAIVPRDLSVKLDNGDYVAIEGTLAFAWDAAAEVLRLSDSAIRLGRSSAVFTGAMRDPPDAAPGDPQRYEFQLVANRGRADPRDSPSSAIRFAGRAEGAWSPETAIVEFDLIELDSSGGRAEGTGRLDFSSSVPTALFASSVSGFTVSGMKQFWPASVARAARRWVLDNLAGGEVTGGEFLIAEPLRRRIDGTDTRLSGSSEISLAVEGVRFDVAGDIPPVRDATGRVEFRDGTAVISLDSGTAYMPSGRTADASNGILVIHPADATGEVFADLSLDVSGEADAIGEIISYRPIDARSYRDYRPEELSGEVEASLAMRFVLNPSQDSPVPDWEVLLQLRGASVDSPFEGRQLSDMTGSVKINRRRAEFDVSGAIDGIVADIDMVMPFDEETAPRRDIVLNMSDPDRARIAPGLETILSGLTPVHVSTADEQDTMSIMADLTPAELALPWLGWSKGAGIGATTIFDLVIGDAETRLDNFNLDGSSFSADGAITVDEAGLQNARFGKVRLNDSDDIAVSILRKGAGYEIDVTGTSFDARSLLRHIRKLLTEDDAQTGGIPLQINARIDRVTGFGDEIVRDLELYMSHDGSDLLALSVKATTTSGFPVFFDLEGAAANRGIKAEALDVGELLRFLDIYGQVRGGIGKLVLSGHGDEAMTGNIRVENFLIFDEPRLKSLVSSGADDSQSLNEAIRREIDTSEVDFDMAAANLAITPSKLAVQQGVVRGPLVGSTFQGTIYDSRDRMRITGTFLPAYGLNSLFADIPVFGLLLGNGRDRGLIGVTYLLEGDAKKPKVSVNPLSLIAPGVFRSIFEFR